MKRSTNIFIKDKDNFIEILVINYLILGLDSHFVNESCRGIFRFSGHWFLTNVYVIQVDIIASASLICLLAPVLPSKMKHFPLDAF